MDRQSRIGMFFFGILLVGILIIGLMIPTFYEWSGADQNRSSPQTVRTLRLVAVFLLIFLLALPWIPSKRPVEIKADLDADADPTPGPRRFQFNVRTLLIAMSLVAVAIVALGSYRLDFCVLLIIASLAFCMWSVTHCLSWKWQMATLVGCMYFPWAWAFIDKSIHKNLDWNMLIAAFGLPSFVPSMFLARLVDRRIEDSPWILIVLTAIELAIGFWMIRLGPKRTIVWMIAVVCCSLLGSMFLDAGMRI